MEKITSVDSHIRIATKIGEQLMVSNFTERQRRILDLILRLSWGCGKEYAVIPRQSDFEIVGVPEGHVKLHLNWLTEAKVIFRDKDRYSFNKNYDQWRVSRSLAYTEDRLKTLVSINLAQKVTENGTLTENVSSKNLRKTELSTYGKRKLPEAGLASPIVSIINNTSIPNGIEAQTTQKLTENVSSKKTGETETPLTTAGVGEALPAFRAQKNGDGSKDVPREAKPGKKAIIPSPKGAGIGDPIVNELFREMETYLGFPTQRKTIPIPSYPREGSFIKKMLQRGFTKEDIFGCWKQKVDRAAGDFVSMAYVNEDIGKSSIKRRPSYGAIRGHTETKPAFAGIKPIISGPEQNGE